jgi:asparagine synthase (glutamine-hydrolysing)
MLRMLKNAVFTAVEQAINNETSVAIAFSGGLDSSLLAKICKDLGIDVTLLTVGFSESHDISFSKKIASIMNLPHRVLKLDNECFLKDTRKICNKVKCTITSHIENCIGFFYIGKFAHASGYRTVLTANGCDELFCGYDIFRFAYNQGIAGLVKLMEEKLENEFILMQEVDSVLKESGVAVKQPFLSSDFISFAKSVPVGQKIIGPNDFVRKHILRQLAVSMEIPPQSAMQRKKALQYSSLIHRNFCKLYRESQSLSTLSHQATAFINQNSKQA